MPLREQEGLCVITGGGREPETTGPWSLGALRARRCISQTRLSLDTWKSQARKHLLALSGLHMTHLMLYILFEKQLLISWDCGWCNANLAFQLEAEMDCLSQ